MGKMFGSFSFLEHLPDLSNRTVLHIQAKMDEEEGTSGGGGGGGGDLQNEIVFRHVTHEADLMIHKRK
jgi:hypothetical protein